MELLVLGVLAVIIFGPERLPKLAADAGRFLRQVRRYVNSAQRDLQRELGPDFGDLTISDLTPRGLVRRALLDPDDYVSDLDLDVDLSGNGMAPRRPVRPLEAGETPPYDPETT
jgi:sec-independent protein translocase protein TatB